MILEIIISDKDASSTYRGDNERKTHNGQIMLYVLKIVLIVRITLS